MRGISPSPWFAIRDLPKLERSSLRESQRPQPRQRQGAQARGHRRPVSTATGWPVGFWFGARVNG